MPIVIAILISMTTMFMANEMDSWGRKWVEKGNFENAETCFNTALALNLSGITLSITILVIVVLASRKRLA